MTNAIRGEVELQVKHKGEEKTMIMCVTTGALAELETELGKPTSQLEQIIAASEMPTINSVIYWLLRGGGNDLEKKDMITLSFKIKPAIAAIREAFKAWSESDEDDTPKG